MSPRWNWDSPTPLAASECAPPPYQRVGGHTRLLLKGGGGVPIPTTGETLSTLPTLWYEPIPHADISPSNHYSEVSKIFNSV